MPRIPAATAPIARAFLSQLGLDADVIDDSGDLDLEDLAGELVYDVTVETAVAPPQRIKIRKEKKAEPKPPPEPKRKKKRKGFGDRLARFIQPAVTLRGPYGEKRFAPFGRPDADAWKRLAWKAGVGAVLALGVFAAGGFLLGRWTARGGTRALSGGPTRRALSPPVYAR